VALLPVDRVRTANQWARENKFPVSWSKTDMLNAVNAVDDWIDANQASYNSALPAAVRTGATLAQKIDLMMYVLMRRQGRLVATEDS
jgi:hypothetical protein